MNMNIIDFYRRYDEIAVQRETLNATKIDMPDKEIREKELDLAEKTNGLFADWTGTRLNFLA